MKPNFEISCFNVNKSIVDNGSERLLAIRTEEDRSTVNLKRRLPKPFEELFVYRHLLWSRLLPTLLQQLRIVSLLFNPTTICDEGSELRVRTPAFLLRHKGLAKRF